MATPIDYPRTAGERGPELTTEEVDAAAARLAAHLVADPDALGWIEAKMAGAAWAEALEGDRWDLTNRWFKDVVKRAPTDPTAASVHFIGAGLEERLEAVARATLPFDRANALVNMQIVRGDGNPRGFAWITERDLAAFKAAGKAPAFGGTEQCYSVARAYVAASAAGRHSFSEYVARMTAPMAPAWLNEAFGLGLSGPETLRRPAADS